jgi:hypothetical protein
MYVFDRYLAEFKTGAERKDAAENTMVAYKAAQVVSLTVNLLLRHPVCLFVPFCNFDSGYSAKVICDVFSFGLFCFSEYCW